MIANIKELLRWLTFIPVPLIAGPLAGALLLIPILFIKNFLAYIIGQNFK